MDAAVNRADADMADPPTTAPAGAAAAAGSDTILATLTHGGRFIQYNIFGNVFEVTAKYKPPIMPIGRGAYGLVW